MLLFILPALPLKSKMVRTVCNGVWQDTAVWEGGNPPAAGDSILVRHRIKNVSPINFDQNHLRIQEKAALCGYHPLEIPSGSSLYNFGFLGVSSMKLQDSLINHGRLVSDSSISITGYLVNKGGSITVGTFSCFDKPSCTPAIVAIQGDSIASNTKGASYKWYFEGNSLGDSSKRIALQGSGTYRVRILHATGDSTALSPAYEHTATSTPSTRSLQAPRVTVLPNPNKGRFMIRTPSPDRYGRFRVLDIRGRTLTRRRILRERTRIDLSAHGNGMYWIRIEGSDGTRTQKVIVQKR